jgi:hypothetical protein
MEKKFDPALIQLYVDQCLLLGLRNQAGEDVSDSIKGTVDKAFSHFENRMPGAPTEDKHRFASQLRTFAGLLGQASPLQAKVLMDAHVRASAKLSKT